MLEKVERDKSLNLLLRLSQVHKLCSSVTRSHMNIFNFALIYHLQNCFQEKEIKDVMSKIDCENVCVEKLEEILQTLNVKRQAYHGKSFVGNHVHKMLKVKIINNYQRYGNL